VALSPRRRPPSYRDVNAGQVPKPAGDGHKGEHRGQLRPGRPSLLGPLIWRSVPLGHLVGSVVPSSWSPLALAEALECAAWAIDARLKVLTVTPSAATSAAEVSWRSR